MMKHRYVRTLVAGVALTALSGASGTLLAAPNGPWVTPQQTISLQAFSDYAELTGRLESIARASRGTVQIESIGTSGEGRDIWLARIGDASKPAVLIFTQQHGDEPHGTEAMLDLARFLGTGSRAADRILDQIQVLIIPRVNVDGAELPTRGNTDFTAPPRDSGQCPAAGGDDADGQGIFSTRFRDTEQYSYDINRYHWPVWEDSWQYLCNVDGAGDPLYPTNPVPEAVAVLGVHEDYQPIWALDIHNQGFNVVDPAECDADDACRAGRYVTGSLLWPTNEEVDPDAVELSKQMALVMKERSTELGNVELTRYAGGDFSGIARNAYGLLGGGSVLFEVAGQTEGSPSINNGQKAIGKLVNGIRKVVSSLLEATADGTLYERDADRAETVILDNDVSLPNPRLD